MPPSRKAAAFAGRRVRNYRRPYGRWYYHPALRDGHFTRWDVPAMQQDPAIHIGLYTIFAPLFSATWEVRANSREIKTFVENTLYRFWHHDLFKVLQHYVPYGTAVGEVLYEQDRDSGLWKYAGLDDFDMNDVQAMRRGRHLTGARVSYGSVVFPGPYTPTPDARAAADGGDGQDEEGRWAWNELRHPKLFWCAHASSCGEPWGRSTFESAWAPWAEKVFAHGAISIRKLWAFGNAYRGCLVKYPPGTTMVGGRRVDNRDLAQELAETYATGGAFFVPNDRDEKGEPLWEVLDPKQNGEVRNLIEYPAALDKEIFSGLGVLDDVIRAPDTGGSWSGRSGPLLIFLNISDMRVREILTAFDVGPSGYTTRNEQAGGVVRSLVLENFGPKARYEIRPYSLVPKPMPPGGGPGAGPGAGPGPGPGGPGPAGAMGGPPGPKAMGGPPAPAGAPPVPLSGAGAPPGLDAVELPDAEVAAALAGNGDVALSGGLFDESSVRRDKGGRFTFKAVKEARAALAAGRLRVRHSEDPVTSDASGEPIRHYVEVAGGRLHPDELHRMAAAGESAELPADEGLEVHEPGGRSKAHSFADALGRVAAFRGRPADAVTIVSRHGYSATRPRHEWTAMHDAGEPAGSFSAWYDAEGHEHTGRHVEGPPPATMAGAAESEAYFAPRDPEQGHLAFSATFDPQAHPRGQPQNKGEFVAKGHGQAGGAVQTSAPPPRPAAPAKASAKAPAKAHTPPQAAPKPQGSAPAPSEPSAIMAEAHTPPPPGKAFAPNVEETDPKTGVTKAARVGVPANEVPPPPNIARLPRLTDHERAVEAAFIRDYEANPEGKAAEFRNVAVAVARDKGDVPTFGTDDAKGLNTLWTDPDETKRLEYRATLNTPLHQTANAIAKRAFLQHLDTLQPGDQVMVTVGGCGAGKGFALKKVPQALALKKQCKAVWDSAGDQCANENPWIQAEAEKRGLKVHYVYVHADPKNQWANPELGVVKRAQDPGDGRMVGCKVFADSYAIGARNMQTFYEHHKGNPNAHFVFLMNKAQPEELPGIPPKALNIDRKSVV